MKFKIILILFLFLYQETISQDTIWNTYDLDSIVSLEMPFTVYEYDTISENTKIYEMYSENESSKFSVRKVYLGNQSSKTKMSILPMDAKSLKNFYLDIIDVLNEINEFDLEYGGSIQKNNLHGYSHIQKDDNGKSLYETCMFYVNENLYSFSYYNINGLNAVDRNFFFDSIDFNKDDELHQYPIKKMSAIKKIALGLVTILIISFILRVNSKRKIAS